MLRAVLLVLVIPALIVVAYAALSLQGHQEDFPSQPMQTWPIGASSLTLAASLAWIAIRPTRGLQPAVLSIALATFVVAWLGYLL